MAGPAKVAPMTAGSGEALRREQLRQSLDGMSHRGLLSVAEAVNATVPLIEAALAAARVATATEIAEAIEARCVDGQLCVEEPCFLCNGLKIAADIARRGSVPAPKGDQ